MAGCLNLPGTPRLYSQARLKPHPAHLPRILAPRLTPWPGNRGLLRRSEHADAPMPTMLVLPGATGVVANASLQAWQPVLPVSDPAFRLRPLSLTPHTLMALPSTIYKADVNIADNDRAYYGSHSLTLARHPSETDERLMVRLLAYALNADADGTLRFTRGLSEADEPELWRLDLTGAVQTWIEVGAPDEKRILKACGRADEVIVYAYGRNAPLWWSGVQNKLRKAGKKLRVFILPAEATASLAALARRGMSLNVNIQDETAWISSETGEASIDIVQAPQP